MSEDNNIYDLKVEIEGIKKDLENVSSINSRLDMAIEKLADVSSSIKSMLAVHEEKIAQQERTDEIIFEKIKDRAEEIDAAYRDWETTYRDWETDRKSTRLNSSHLKLSRMPSSA